MKAAALKMAGLKMTMNSRQALDLLFCVYFAFQIPTTIILDTQGMFPSWMYPQWARDLKIWYISQNRDPFLGNAYSFPWFASICVVEFVLEVPLFFFACYAYYKGAECCPWIRVPSMLYAVHTITAVLCILSVVWMEDFSKYPSTLTTPRNQAEKTRLSCVYLPFLVISFLLLVDTVRGYGHVTKDKDKLR